MAKGKRQAYDEYQRVQRAVHRAEQESGSHDGAHVHGEALAPPGMSVGDARLAGRGNRPVRIAAMQQIQRTQGNRAAQRLMRGGATPVQRQVQPVQRDLFSDIGEGISKGISSIGSALGSAFDSVEEWLGGGEEKGGKSGAKKGAKKEHSFKKVTHTLSDEDVTLVHERKEKTNKKGKVTEKGRSEIRKSPAVYTAEILALTKGIKASDWFSEFTSIKFLGTRFNKPIHIELASHLKEVEDKLLQQYGGEESDPDKKAETVRNAVGLTTEAIRGGRDDPTSADLSMHLFGLAIDVNFKQNPYIGVSANPVFKRAGLLVEDKPARFVSEGKMDYDELVALNKVITTYFSYIDNRAELEKRLALVNETEWEVDGPKGEGKKKKKSAMKKWKGMTADDVVKIIQADLDWLAAKWDRSGAKDVIKAGGFTNLKKELVDGLDLAWGGSGYGDMMHFDLRNKGKGKQVHTAIVRYKKKQEKAAAEQYKKEHEADAGTVPAQPYRVQRLVAGKDGRVVQRYRPSRFATYGNRAVQRSRVGNVSVQRDPLPGGAVADNPKGATSPAAPKTVAEAMLIIKKVETAGGPRYPAIHEVRQLEEAIKLLEDTGRYTVDRTTYKVSFKETAGTKLKVDTIEDFILFVETVERAYPAATPKMIASEIRQMWFSDVNWEVLVGSQGITEGSGGSKKYRDIETEAPIAAMFDMKDLAPSKGTKVITTPMGAVTISHVMAGIDARLSGMAPAYPESFLEDRERDTGKDHDTYSAEASYNALKKASNGNPRDFTTWSGDLGQGYADYIVERWLKGTASVKLDDFMKAKADDAALLADIHGYIAVEVWKNIPISQSPSGNVMSVSNILRDFYLTDKKSARLGQDYLAYFEDVAKKKGEELRPFILDRVLAFAGVWYGKEAYKHKGFWGSSGLTPGGMIENHIAQFNKYHKDNETLENDPNKIGTYIDKFMAVLGQKMR
jgi:hypothetical protein